MRWPTFLRSTHRAARVASTRVGSRRLTLEALEPRDVPSYAITDLGVTAGFDGSYALGLNQVGDVTGYEWANGGVSHAFLWHNGVMSDLGTLGGNYSYAYAVNDAGQVVGVSDSTETDVNGNQLQHAFLWQNGGMTDLGTLGGTTSRAYAINASGQIVGDSTTTDDAEQHAFLWQSGTMLDLGTLPGGYYSSASGINNSGQIVGTADSGIPFIWQAGSMTALDLGGNDYGSASAINDAGQIVGSVTGYDYWNDVYYTNATIWEGGQLNYLPSLYGGDSYAYSINNAGQVLGNNYDPVIWQNGSVTNLDTQVPLGTGYLYTQAINDAGQIVGSVNGHAALLNAVPDFSITSVTVTEGNTGSVTATFTIQLSAPSTSPTTVHYSTADGTAIASRDYVSTSDTLTFNPGDTQQQVTVAVIGDRIDEYDEYFTLNLSAATNAGIANGQGVGTILDDDPPPTIVINDASVVEGNSGSKLMVFTVSLSGASEKPISVNYSTANGTAKTSNHDYTVQSGTLYFAAGETTKTISIVVYGDKKKEPNETFFVNLSGAFDATILDSQGIGTIVNDDGPHQ